MVRTGRFFILDATSGKKEVLTRISGAKQQKTQKGFELGDFKILHQYSNYMVYSGVVEGEFKKS